MSSLFGFQNKLAILLILLVIFTSCLVLPSAAQATVSGAPWDNASAEFVDDSAQVTAGERQSGDDTSIDTSDTDGGTSASSVLSNSDRHEKPSKYLVLERAFCFGMNENHDSGYLNCFEAERLRCRESGSRMVVAVTVERADPSTVIDESAPYCSSSPNPVINDPATAGESEAPPMPVVTLADFRALDIKPSKVESDTGGFGLIRANTNFYALENPQTLNTTMLGQQVTIQAIPVQWTFDYGDGTTPLVSTTPGGPQREFNQATTTSHAYQDTGTYPVTVTTAYRGQFAVNDGPWIAIPGTATVPSTPAEADIWRSKAKNVAEDCHQNPDGWACTTPFADD